MIIDENGKEFNLKKGFCLFYDPRTRTISLSEPACGPRLLFSDVNATDNKRIFQCLEAESDFIELVLFLAELFNLKLKISNYKNSTRWFCELAAEK